MSKPKSGTEKDLFGYPVKKRINKYERLLTKIDKESFHSRADRLKYVESIIGDTGMLGSLETVFVFREAGWAYINGEFISTVMLAQAFIERVLHDFLVEKGLEKEAKSGAQAIIRYCRENQLVNEFLLDKFDRLRQIRNPFVHSKPFDNPFNLANRTVFEQISPNELAEKDAKEALGLMYTILFTR